jgi:RNA polymerase sigma factor (TIGR02999 family)
VSRDEEISGLVDRWGSGDRAAFDELVTLLYDDLHELARGYLRRERFGHTLDTSALVHEAYAQLAGSTGPSWRGRSRFFAFLSRVMRHVLVDYARRRNSAKRGGGAVLVTLHDARASYDPQIVDLLELDDALQRLSERSTQLATVVECRFFGGLTFEETADALGVSERTVERDWKRARAYLLRMLSESAQGSE